MPLLIEDKEASGARCDARTAITISCSHDPHRHRSQIRHDNLSLKMRHEKQPEHERIEISELCPIKTGQNDGI